MPSVGYFCFSPFPFLLFLVCTRRHTSICCGHIELLLLLLQFCSQLLVCLSAATMRASVRVCDASDAFVCCTRFFLLGRIVANYRDGRISRMAFLQARAWSDRWPVACCENSLGSSLTLLRHSPQAERIFGARTNVCYKCGAAVRFVCGL